MNKFKTFYLDFALVYGTLCLFMTMSMFIGNLSYGRNQILLMVGMGIAYSTIKLFWDNYHLEKIASLENEIKQLKEEAAKRATVNN
jgi:hypothetical protein